MDGPQDETIQRTRRGDLKRDEAKKRARESIPFCHAATRRARLDVFDRRRYHIASRSVRQFDTLAHSLHWLDPIAESGFCHFCHSFREMNYRDNLIL